MKCGNRSRNSNLRLIFSSLFFSVAMHHSAVVMAATDELNEHRLYGLFNKAVEISGAVGAQLSIIKGDQQLDFTHGLANSELNIPMTQDTGIQIGSTTKIINAMLVMILVEDGVLKLDTPVIQYIPEFKVADPVATQTLTLRHLLSMSSGLDNGDYPDHGTGDDALEKYIATLDSLPQHFLPGSAFGYSNAGSDIAGYVAQRVAGQYWDDLMMERIIGPAGLKTVATRAGDRMYQRVSVGHYVEQSSGAIRVIRPWSISKGHAPAGSTLTSSAHDLARLGRLFLRKGMADTGENILSERSLNEMMAAQNDVPLQFIGKFWGLGPWIDTWDGVKLWGHGGGNVSGKSFLYWIPDKKAVIAFTVNTPAAMRRFEKVMFEEVMNEAFAITKPKIKIPNPPLVIDDPQRFVGLYRSRGYSCTIEASNDQLNLFQTCGETGERVMLVPLGGDRFLMSRGDSDDPHVLLRDMSFFGRDDDGRAMTLLNSVFPLSREKQ